MVKNVACYTLSGHGLVFVHYLWFYILKLSLMKPSEFQDNDVHHGGSVFLGDYKGNSEWLWQIGLEFVFKDKVN